jgi:hypothetical protein
MTVSADKTLVSLVGSHYTTVSTIVVSHPTHFHLTSRFELLQLLNASAPFPYETCVSDVTCVWNYAAFNASDDTGPSLCSPSRGFTTRYILFCWVGSWSGQCQQAIIFVPHQAGVGGLRAPRDTVWQYQMAHFILFLWEIHKLERKNCDSPSVGPDYFFY